ncbi:MAG: hypothetical protein HQK54_09295 [Oligoflexales bacterium]|nr:hypothetical protein [Oligoflexales bacterium]
MIVKLSKNFFIKIITAILLFPASMFFNNAGAEEADSYSLNLSFDANFLYLDKMKRPDTSGEKPPKPFYNNSNIAPFPNFLKSVAQPSSLLDSNPAAAAPLPRTMGIRYLKLLVDVEKVRSSALHLVFRPDIYTERYTDKTAQPKEFDSRSGMAYRPKPTVNLIDSYYITVHQGDTFDFDYGVFEQLAPTRSSYPQVLEFGLVTELPEKFLGLRISTKLLKDDNSSPTISRKRGAVYSVIAYEGRNDRGELFEYNIDKQDTGTVAKDPYIGMALQATFYPSEITDYGLTFGTGDTKLEFGRKNELFGDLFAITHFKLFKKLCKLTLDSRISKERWSSDVQRYRELIQQSHSLTLAQQMGEKDWLAIGFHYGISERHVENDTTNIEEVSGWQADLGYLRNIALNTSFTFFTTQEQRKSYINKRKVGAFKFEDKTEFNLMRFGLELRYYLANYP